MERLSERVCRVSLLLVWMIFILHPFRGVDASDEGDALIVFKNAITNDPGGNLQGWDGTLANPCTWFHVMCNNANNVTRVDLGNAGLEGHLVPELGIYLKNLQYLALYNNALSGSIPSELGNLANLVSLDLYNNNLNGPIPDSLGKLSKLQKLELYNNTLSGSIPSELGNLANLLSLDLFNNNLNGSIPDSLGKLSKLQILRLDRNRLGGSIPVTLTRISTLKVMDLSNNSLSGYVPDNGSFAQFTPRSFENNHGLCGPGVGTECDP